LTIALLQVWFINFKVRSGRPAHLAQVSARKAGCVLVPFLIFITC